MARISRPPFRRKTGLRISKGEAALEHAFKELDVYKVTETATITRVPDIILVEASATSGVATVTIDTGSEPQAFNREVRIVNNEGADNVVVKVVSGTGVTVPTGTRKSLYIEDASVADSQIALD